MIAHGSDRNGQTVVGHTVVGIEPLAHLDRAKLYDLLEPIVATILSQLPYKPDENMPAPPGRKGPSSTIQQDHPARQVLPTAIATSAIPRVALLARVRL